VSGHFRALTATMNISNDDFIRTTEPRHIRAAQALWQRMQERGHIYLGAYAGWYAVRDEAYYAESELVEGKAPTGASVEWVEEPSYFFRLSEFQDKLLAHYDANPDFILPSSRRNEVISFVKGGLKDLSISRTVFSWGIPVPGHAKHIMYVWLDALANYLSALGYENNQSFNSPFWPPSLHIVGKDILRFHAVYWPAFLMAAGLELPKRIFAHGWWTIEGQKISKSLGNVITPDELVQRYGLDQTRWFLLREVPFGNDGNFSHDTVISRINSELANTIGNLAQRTLSLVHKHCAGKIPSHKQLSEEEKSVLYGDSALASIEEAFDKQAFHEASAGIVALAVTANQYIDAKAPWTLKKENTTEMEHVLYVLLEYIRIIGLLLQPFIPSSASRLLDMLGVAEQRGWTALSAEAALVSGAALPPPEPLFPRINAVKEGE